MDWGSEPTPAAFRVLDAIWNLREFMFTPEEIRAQDEAAGIIEPDQNAQLDAYPER